MNTLNQTQSNSNTTTDNSTEITEEIKTPTENITSNSSLLPILQTITNSDALLSDARQKQNVLQFQNFYSKKMQQTLTKEQLHSHILTHRPMVKDSKVSNPPPYANNEFMFSRILETLQLS